MKQSVHTFRGIVGAALALLAVLALPTGWLYDLWAGTGTEQGQRPSEDVRQIQCQEDVETFFLSSTPATVSGGGLAACPLARLRDPSREGVHYHSRRGAKRSVYISEYIAADYPIPVWQRVLQSCVSGSSYNRYYLTELGDGSWLCVYFDDYLALAGGDTLPVGYVRYGANAEKIMLSRMAADYDVVPDYVLDMYRYGKVSWMLDLGLRLIVVLAVYTGAAAIAASFRKQRAESAEIDDGNRS